MAPQAIITVRKLSRPDPVAPSAEYRAVTTYKWDDGSSDQFGNWYGRTREAAISNAMIAVRNVAPKIDVLVKGAAA